MIAAEEFARCTPPIVTVGALLSTHRSARAACSSASLFRAEARAAGAPRMPGLAPLLSVAPPRLRLRTALRQPFLPPTFAAVQAAPLACAPPRRLHSTRRDFACPRRAVPLLWKGKQVARPMANRVGDGGSEAAGPSSAAKKPLPFFA